MADASPSKVLVIGASRGIGLGLVREYLDRGWSVTATVRDPGGSPALAALAAEAGARLAIERVDTAQAASAAALRDRLADETFDVVIVNAGVGGPMDKSTRTVTDAEFSELFITNALAPVRLAERLVKLIRPGSGVIGLMTSQLGSVEGASAGGMELYRASKAALNSFTRSFAARHRDKGLAVLSLHPGWVRTDMGGPGADIDVETSVKGMADVIDRARSDRADGFFNYKGETLPW
jgi:NAD(P)-dependent dehydrogenase (short-subunit alcohol dehydrogenase family)